MLHKKLYLILAAFLGLFLSGCSATTKYVKYRNLDTQTKMSETIFLEPLEESQKTVYLQIRNTTDKTGLEIEPEIRRAIEAKGYKIVNSPSKAHVMVQANILQVGRATQEDPFRALTGGYGSALSGAVAGGSAAYALGANSRAAVGVGLATGAVESLSDSAVDVVTYSMVTDIQISEKANGAVVSESSKSQLKQGNNSTKTSTWSEQSNWKRYQTRVVSVSRKVNLKFEEAEPSLTEGLARSISGLL